MSSKRKNKLCCESTIQMHSITDLFKKQNERNQSRAESISNMDLDEDIEITKIEMFPLNKTSLCASPALNKSQTNSTNVGNKKRRLSLNKSGTRSDIRHINSLVGNIICEQKDSGCSNSLSLHTIIDSTDIKDSILVSSIPCLSDQMKAEEKEITCEIFPTISSPDKLSAMHKFAAHNDENPTCHNVGKKEIIDIGLLDEKNNINEQENSCFHVENVLSNNPVVTDNDKKPYYLSNFETILNNVINDASNLSLFNSDDLAIISTFQSLTESAKKLYIRMFCRKLNWIPLNKLNYVEISEDVTPFLKELQETGFIQADDDMNDLEEILLSLTAADIKSLAKSYHISTNVNQKRQLVYELMKISQKNSISSLFGCKSGDLTKSMAAKAKKFFNGIYKLKLEPRKVFVRVMMLFSVVNTSVEDDTGASGQMQLFQLLMVNMGKLVYPSYTVDKVHNIFSGRDAVIRFEQALQLESDLLNCVQRGQWDKAYDIFICAEEQWEIIQSDDSSERFNKDLPEYLRTFTASSVFVRMMTVAIDILQRRKDFKAAVELLNKLLSQTVYNCSHRGYWWERLALNLDAHLKKPEKSLEAIGEGLSDQHVIGGHRLALYLRAESICSRSKSKLSERLSEFYHDPVTDIPKVFLEGRVLHEGMSTNGTKFLTQESYADGDSQNIVVCGVEEYVLEYYKKNGFPSGVHAEGSVVSSLFSLFFWDIIFTSLPDAFHSPFQAMPLDLYSNSFYERRKDVIEMKLNQLMESSIEELHSMAEDTWVKHEGSQCVGMGWERMRSLELVKELIECLGGKLLSGLLARHARCPRHTRSGFPDLTLWSTQTKRLKICEVKGPGDRLSHKQILWLDYLLKMGVDAEVCHVKAVAAKRLRY